MNSLHIAIVDKSQNMFAFPLMKMRKKQRKTVHFVIHPNFLNAYLNLCSVHSCVLSNEVYILLCEDRLAIYTPHQVKHCSTRLK